MTNYVIVYINIFLLYPLSFREEDVHATEQR